MRKINTKLIKLTTLVSVMVIMLLGTACSSLPSNKQFSKRMERMPTVPYKSSSVNNAYTEEFQCTVLFVNDVNLLACTNKAKEALMGEFLTEEVNGAVEVMMYNYNLKEEVCLPSGIFSFNFIKREYTTIPSNLDLEQLTEKCDLIKDVLGNDIFK